MQNNELILIIIIFNKLNRFYLERIKWQEISKLGKD